MNESLIKTLSNIIINQESDLEPLTAMLKPNFEAGVQHYQSHYLWSLIDSLKAKFPSLNISLSEQNFNYFARKYILKNPSSSENIDDYGSSFVDFLLACAELKSFNNLDSLGKIDWFLYCKNINHDKHLNLPKNSLKLWKNIISGDEIIDIDINDSAFEIIEIVSEDSDVYLVSSALDQ